MQKYTRITNRGRGVVRVCLRAQLLSEGFLDSCMQESDLTKALVRPDPAE